MDGKLSDHHQALTTLVSISLKFVVCVLLLACASQLAGSGNFLDLPDWITDLAGYLWGGGTLGGIGVYALIVRGQIKLAELSATRILFFGGVLALFVCVLANILPSKDPVSSNETPVDSVLEEVGEKYPQKIEGSISPNEVDENPSIPKEVKRRNQIVLEIEEYIDSLSDHDLKGLMGQIFFVGTDSTLYKRSPRSNISILIEDFNVGGLIFYGSSVDSNYTSTSRVKNFMDLVAEVKQNNFDNEHFPLFLATDFEGGNTAPLAKKDVMLPIPAAMAIGGTRDQAVARAAGEIAGLELRALGLNMNFAPVIDVSISSDDNVILDRSYGANQSLVSDMASSFMQGLSKSGIIPVVKHFPGHGGTDAGFETAGVPESSYDLRSLSGALKPFRELAVSLVADEDHFLKPAVMTSHFKANGISDEVVTFDKRIISGLLQESSELQFRDGTLTGVGFEGLVIADNLLAPSVTGERSKCAENLENFEVRIFDVAVKAFEAGHHMLMLSHVFSSSTHSKNMVKNEGGQNTKTCSRWAMTTAEFGSLFSKLKEYIFSSGDLVERRRRIRLFKNALAKILLYKRMVVKEEVSIESYVELHSGGKIGECVDRLFEKTFVLRKPVRGGTVFSEARKDENIVVFIPTRWSTYKGIERVRSDPERYRQEVEDEVSAYDWPREINRYFGSKTGLHFELEKENPASANEWPDRAKRVAEIVIDEHKADFVVFIVNKKARWGVAQHSIVELKRRGFNVGNINVLVTDHPTMLRYMDSDLEDEKYTLRDAVYLIAYSGYGRRAGILMSSLLATDGEKFNARPPIEVPGIFDMADSIVTDSSFDCVSG